MIQLTEKTRICFYLAGVEGLSALLISNAFLPDEGRSETPQNVTISRQIVPRFLPSTASHSGRA